MSFSVTTGVARAQGIWDAEVGSSITATKNGVRGALELFFPLLQSDTGLFYADLRFDPEHFSEAKGSFGIGTRQVINNNLMLGGYVFYNNQAAYGLDFEGVTLGAEAFTGNWDGRLNVYVPLTDSVIGAPTSGVNLAIVGNTLQASTPTRIFRHSHVVDAELGYTIQSAFGPGSNLRLYGGGYHV